LLLTRDTLRFDPIAGVNVRIMRNVLVNGVATQVLAAQLVTDALGRFAVKDLAGGYYVVYAEPPAGSVWSNSFSYLDAKRRSNGRCLSLAAPQSVEAHDA